MKKQILAVFMLLTLMTIPSNLFGQEENNTQEPLDQDFAIWGRLIVKKHIVSGLSASINGEFRTKENSSEFDRWRVNPELQFKFNDYFDVSAGYIYYRTNQTTHYQGHHRWYGAVRMAIGVGPVKIHLRERFEQTIKEDMEPGTYGRIYNYLRSRLGAEVKLENLPITPYANVENFLYVFEYKGGEVAEMRYTAGLKYKFAKIHTIDLYYRIVQPLPTTELTHVMGIDYTISF